MKQDFADLDLARPQFCEAELSGVLNAAKNAPSVHGRYLLNKWEAEALSAY
jgi:hypothetical protein